MTVGVGFDFDHTLGIDNKLERVAFLRLLELLISGGGKALGTLDEETAHIDALLAAQRAGEFSIEQAVERFSRAHVAGPGVSSYVQTYKDIALESVPYFVVPLPGARALLEDLRARGVRTAILTNGWSPLQEAKAACIGFDGPVIVSERIGSRKPERPAFEALLAALGVTAGDAWYVGDSPAVDVAGSIAAGLRGVWLDAESLSYPADLVRPTEVIHTLESLLNVLPGSPTLA